MILQNNTKISNNLIQDIIKEAAALVGCDYHNVFYKVSTYKGKAISGYSVRINVAPENFITKKGLKDKAIDLNGGYVYIKIPKIWFVEDGCKSSAEEIIRGFLHESRHIRDFQEGIAYSEADMRKRWKNRPWEIDAMNAEKNLVIFNKELINRLAEELENILL